MKRLLVLTAFAVPVFFASCGNDKSKTPETTTTEQTKEPATNDSGTPVSNTVELTASDEMKFDKTELKALAGKPITLTFAHIGTMDKNVMGHNFILLKKGTDIDDFVKKALTAKDNDYIPKSESDKIIAHTKLLPGGATDTIEFTVPEKGTYDFICSFPGHAATMRGKFIVE